MNEIDLKINIKQKIIVAMNIKNIQYLLDMSEDNEDVEVVISSIIFNW